jgi:ribosomal 50S subunit-recycling heat shock protein
MPAPVFPAEDAASMRLDLFLKKARLVHQRSAAKELCDAGGVLLNGKPAKPSQDVRPGDRLQLQLLHQDLEVRIRELPHGNVSRAVAATLIEVLRDQPADRIGRVFGGGEAEEVGE